MNIEHEEPHEDEGKPSLEEFAKQEIMLFSSVLTYIKRVSTKTRFFKLTF